MRKSWFTLAVLIMTVTLIVGCGSNNGNNAGTNTGSNTNANTNAGANEGANEGSAEAPIFKVGMVTDAGTIDDKSFNQGTWEGVVQATEEFGIEHKYLKPAGTTEADYMKEIGNLYDAGFKLIIAPGFKFETAIFQAQDKYPDAKFVILDGAPHAGDFAPVVKENTVSIFFAEHESGFLAGVATALQLKEGEAGFIGGMEIPAVQKFNWGFQQGLKYANENLSTNITIKPENVIYQGSFDNVAAGSQLAAQMYDSGVDVVFAAAGGVGVGAITEAKNRATKGENVWIVGVDVDQYADGVYDGEKSIILTSAMKKIDQAAYDMVKAEKDGAFPGGETLTLDSKNNGVGIPEENPNLSAETVAAVGEIFTKIQSGEIAVAAVQGDLIK
ncbi:BMP family lipoprotein [Paenibacillus abyssi]|uniref:BMP family ABC transporter substrate-binding protein n=1 Tax=Paenibacillus abyssi TaxID=1340531 RepID=A0A917CPY5_9BACL|nr:BMP family ABC transporter substrate-binding protein [Paenibacillus abyssi]GGF94770.1 BMP family ABC transporter substrate-binding protein [Paenibacillus abyssi]